MEGRGKIISGDSVFSSLSGVNTGPSQLIQCGQPAGGSHPGDWENCCCSWPSRGKCGSGRERDGPHEAGHLLDFVKHHSMVCCFFSSNKQSV